MWVVMVLPIRFMTQNSMKIWLETMVVQYSGEHMQATLQIQTLLETLLIMVVQYILMEFQATPTLLM